MKQQKDFSKAGGFGWFQKLILESFKNLTKEMQIAQTQADIFLIKRQIEEGKDFHEKKNIGGSHGIAAGNQLAPHRAGDRSCG